MATRKRKIKRKIKKKPKGRPHRVYETKTGRKYVKIKGKRLYFNTQKGLKELIRLIIKEFNKKPKKKKTRRRKAKAKQPQQLFSGVQSWGSIKTLEQDYHGKKENLEKLRKELMEHRHKILEDIKAESDLLRLTFGEERGKSEQVHIQFLEDVEDKLRQVERRLDEATREKEQLANQADAIRERDTQIQNDKIFEAYAKKIPQSELKEWAKERGIPYRRQGTNDKGKFRISRGDFIRENNLLDDPDFLTAFGAPQFVQAVDLPEVIPIIMNKGKEPEDGPPDDTDEPPGGSIDGVTDEGGASESDEIEDLGGVINLEVSSQDGAGRKLKGLTDQDINEMMKDYKNFVGCFAADEMDMIPLKKKFGFIINTEPRKKKSGHWVACFIDTSKAMTCEYYDSFAEQPSKKFLKGLKNIVDELNPSVYLKLKINKIRNQKTSSGDCGWHSMAFLINRFNNVPFVECSGFSDYNKGLSDVEKVKKKYPAFNYI